jgi:AbrB family looped-hinge helix DNA binding protein
LEGNKVKITSKGQLTLPADVRKKFNINKGDVLIVNSDGRRIVLEVGEKMKKSNPRLKGIVQKTAGMWKDSKIDGQKFVEELRREADKRLGELNIE